MTTQQFIERALRGETKSTSCASVIAVTPGNTEDVTVYSYGTHYPLVKIINGMAFVNTSGYSNTTARHIHRAFSAAHNIVGNNVYGVPLISHRSLTPADILESAEREASRLRGEMLAKRRKDTGVYENLIEQLRRINSTIDVIRYETF